MNENEALPAPADNPPAGGAQPAVGEPGEEERCAAIARDLLVQAAESLSRESAAAHPDAGRLERLVARMEMLAHALASQELRGARAAMEERLAVVGDRLEGHDEKILSVVQRMAGTLTAMNARLQRLEEAWLKDRPAKAEAVPAPAPARPAPPAPADECPQPEPEPLPDDPLKGRLSSALAGIAAVRRAGTAPDGTPEDG